MTELTIKELNARGEGVGATPDGRPILIPFTLPGERVTYRLTSTGQPLETPRGLPTQILSTNPHRQEAPCPYFTRCGGCLLQHMDDSFYTRFKTDLVHQAFREFSVEIASFKHIPPGRRQRINVKALKKKGEVLIGLHHYRTHQIEPINACLLLTPRLNALISPLRPTLEPLLNEGEEANIFLTDGANGIDILIDRSSCKKAEALSLVARERLIVCARVQGIVRINARYNGGDELIYQEAEPFITLMGYRLFFPPNPFLQTSAEAAAHMIETVIGFLPERPRRIADLFSGLGTFSFPLSERGPVTAFEGTPSAVHFLNLSASRQKMRHPLRAEPRDLFKYPLSENELNAFDTVIINPPRAGAVAQIKKLRASQVSTIIMVSCNAHTFARDAQLLIGGGYSMSALHLIDQFLWSPHIEVIGRFHR